LLHCTIIQADQSRTWIESHNLSVVDDLDTMIPIKVRRMERDPIVRSSAGQIIFGQIRPVVGRIWVTVIEQQTTSISLSPQGLCGRLSGRAGTYYDHGVQALPRPCPTGW
jgi:hypothetical protein